MALLSALMFAFTFLFVRIGVKTATTTTALWITLFVNVVFLWSLSLLIYGVQFQDWWQWRYFFLSGVFAPLLGRMFQFQGMARLGANITTPLTLTHPVISVLLAIAFLGEQITWLGFTGAMLVVIGSVVVGSEGGQQQTSSLNSVSRVYLLLPMAASLCYGVSVVFRKMGIDLAPMPLPQQQSLAPPHAVRQCLCPGHRSAAENPVYSPGAEILRAGRHFFRLGADAVVPVAATRRAGGDCPHCCHYPAICTACFLGIPAC